MKKLFTVYDSKTECYGNPFTMLTKGEALRGFADVANDPTTEISKFASDFTLFEIADYDDQKGSIVMHEAKINLGSANEFKKEKN